MADALVMRLCDAVAAFPSVLLALVVLALTGPGKYNVIGALGVLFIPSFARPTASTARAMVRVEPAPSRVRERTSRRP